MKKEVRVRLKSGLIVNILCIPSTLETLLKDWGIGAIKEIFFECVFIPHSGLGTYISIKEIEGRVDN